jgi:metal-sulfur cluster biosynthetic enzyme
MITENEVREVLKQVIDPEIRIDIVNLGLVYDVKIEGNFVYVKMTLTSPGCPVGPQIITEAMEVIKKLEGVQDADVELLWEPPWNPEMMTEEAKDKLGIY